MSMWKKIAPKQTIETNDKQKILISTNTGSSISKMQSPAAAINSTHKVKHVVRRDCFDLELFFTGTSSPTIQCAIEFNGEIYPVTFNGQKQIKFDDNIVVKSDPVAIDLKTGDIFYTRTYISASVTQESMVTTNIANGEGVTTGNVSWSGTTETNESGAIAPLAIIGKSSDTKPSLLLIGSSSVQGLGDENIGFAERIAEKFQYSWTNLGRSSEQYSDFEGVKGSIRRKVLPYGTHAIVYYGSNDLNASIGNMTFEQVKEKALKLFSDLDKRGIKVIPCTVYGLGSLQSKKDYNNWLRALPAPIHSIIDMADIVETSRDSGVVRTGYADGSHLSPLGAQAVADTVNISIFD